MQQLLKTLQHKYPQLHFVPGPKFLWSPDTREIVYAEHAVSEIDNWSLLHETGHALLEHFAYITDFQLLQLEVAAWEQARVLAKEHDIVIDENHIEDCLDTYRDWLHARSFCPTCKTRCLQQTKNRCYRCHNCHTSWSVSASRFCRPYRVVRATS